ncbi:MAG: hypothetical protein LEGION0398_MBIBDBAK_01154 [Legionellaceae bacterium]
MVDAMDENRLSPQIGSRELLILNGYLIAKEHIFLKSLSSISTNPHDKNLLAQRAKFYIALAKTKANYFLTQSNPLLSIKYNGIITTDKQQNKKSNIHYFNRRLRKLRILTCRMKKFLYLKQLKRGVALMVGSILGGLVSAFLWGMDELLYGIPCMILVLVSFSYGLISVLKSEINLYELQKK